MRAVANQMKLVKSEFMANKTAVDQWGDQFKQSETQMKFLTKQIDLQKEKVGTLNKAYEDAVRQKGKDAQETQNLAKRLNYATAELNKMQNELTQTNQKLDQFKENQNIDKFNNDLGALALAMRKVDSEFKLASSAAENFGNELKETVLHGESLTSKLELQRQVVSRLEEEYKRVAQAKGIDATETKQLAIRLDEAKTGLNGLQNELTQTEKKLVTLGNEVKQQNSVWGRFTSDMDNIGGKMQQIGGSLAATGAVGFTTMTFAMKGAVEVGMEFGAQVSRVGAIAGATKDQLGLLKDQALDLGASTSKSASEIAKGQESLAALGFTVEDVIGSMPGVISAAEASGADMAQTAEVMASTLNIFSMEATEAVRVADILAKTANVSAADITDMQYALKYAGPPAAALGISLEELSGSIGIMTNAGMKGEQAGTTLRGALLALLDPSEENSKMMNKMGITITDAQDNFVGLSKLVDNLSKSMKGQTDTQKAATLASLVGTEAVSGMLSLMAAGPKEIDKMTNSLKNSAGASAEAAKQMKDNLAGAMDEMGGALETAKIKFTESLTPAIKGAADTVSGLIDKWNALDSDTQNIIATSAALGTAMLGVTAIVGTLTLGVGALMTFAGPVGLAIVGATAALGALGIGLNAARMHTEDLKKKQEEAEVTARRYGDGLSAGTLKGVKGYTDLYEGAKLKMIELQSMSGEKAKATSQEIVTAFSKMADEVIATLETQKSKLTNAINEVYGIAGDAGKNKAKEMTNEVIKNFDKDIGNYKKALDTVKEAHEKYNNDMSKMPADFAVKYQQALQVMEKGSMEFAKSQQELQTIQKNISSKQGKILFEEAQGYTKSINDTYKKSVEAASKFYADKKKTFDQALAQGRITQDQYATLITGVEAKSNQMLSQAAIARDKALAALGKNLDSQGKLIDIATGKVFERQKTYITDTVNGVTTAIDETNKEYIKRWQSHTQEVLKNASDFSQKTKKAYQDDLSAFLQSTGMTKQEAVKVAKQMVDDALKEMSKGNDKAQKHGKDKGEAHKKGLEGTKEGNKKAGDGVSKSSDEGLSKQKADAEKHGKGKGDAHKKGLDSTKGSNQATSASISDVASKSLGKTTDGGGGKKAGLELEKGLVSQQEAVKISGKSLANSAEGGMKSKDINSIGKWFALGIASGITTNKSGVISAAIGLATSAIAATKKALKIKSPSQVAENEVGYWFTAGVAQGMVGNIGAVTQAALMVAKAAVPNIADSVKITKDESKKLNDVIANVNKQNAKEINDVRVKANKDREAITKESNKKIHAIEQDAKDKKRKLTNSEIRRIRDIEEKAAADRKKVAEKEKKDIAAINKTADAEKLKALQDYVNKRKAAGTMTLEQEVAFWKESDKVFKKGSQEQIKAQKNLNKAKEDLNKQAQQIDEDYLNKVKNLNQKFIDETKRLNDEYQREWDNKFNFIYSSFGLFDEVTFKDVTGQSLIDNLESQNNAVEDWQRNLAELAAKGIDEGLLKELEEMGPRAGAEVAALNGLTGDQLNKYVSLWQEKNRKAKEHATKELEAMRIDTAAKIEQLRQDTANQLLIYQEEWRLAMANAKITVKDQMAEMPSIGEFAVAGLIAGMDSKKGALEAKAKEIADIVESTMKKALKIKSPSQRLSEQVGKWATLGVVDGMDRNLNAVVDASKRMALATIPNMSGMAQTIGSAASTIRNNIDSLTLRNIIQTPNLEKKLDQLLKLIENTAGSNQPKINIENMNFNSPKNLDPYESARMSRNALRELAMQI